MVPGSFIHYEEQCPKCTCEYLRVTHLLIGHPRYPKAIYPEFVDDEWEYFEIELYYLEGLAHERGLPLGELTPKRNSHWPHDESILQSCPACGTAAPAPLCGEGEILDHWADREAHVQIWRPAPGRGWSYETEWVERPIVDPGTWAAFIERKRSEREQARQEEQRRRLEIAAERKRLEEERQRQQEEERLRREAEERQRQEEERRRIEKLWKLDELTRAGKLELERDGRATTLEVAAAQHIKDPKRRGLWLKCPDAKLRAGKGSSVPSPLDAARDSKEGLERALTLLKLTKFH